MFLYSFIAHLSSYSNNSRRNSELYETGTFIQIRFFLHFFMLLVFFRDNSLITLFVGSDIYEDPRVRFEYKKIIPSEPVRMETYLVGDQQHTLRHYLTYNYNETLRLISVYVLFQVPFSNISINLARFLSGQILPSSLENNIESENDGVRSCTFH
jgi:hypothetical protein